MNRRKFLLSASVLGPAFAVLTPKQLFANDLLKDVPTSFIKLSLFLTNKKEGQLSPLIIQRAYTALSAYYPDFDKKESAISEAIAAQKAKNVAEFSQSSAYKGEIKELSTAIIHAYYVGYVGPETDGHVINDNPIFVAYADALMYQPTIDVTVVPSFSRGKTNYWVNPPAHLANK